MRPVCLKCVSFRYLRFTVAALRLGIHAREFAQPLPRPARFSALIVEQMAVLEISFRLRDIQAVDPGGFHDYTVHQKRSVPKSGRQEFCW